MAVILLASFHFQIVEKEFVAKDKARWDHAASLSKTGSKKDDSTGPSTYTTDATPAAYPKFNSLLYSADIILPFFDLDQEKCWMKNKDPSELTNYSILFLKIMGWLLSSIIAVAIAERVESVLARSAST